MDSACNDATKNDYRSSAAAGTAVPEGELPPRGFSRYQRPLFYAFLFILTAACLWPIWANRLLPMQDYPQHLLLARIAATYDNPLYNWSSFYEVDLGLRPYMLWYLAMQALSPLGTETAGKVLLSLYIMLITVLALACRRLTVRGGEPWGALLLFPFAFNQMYYLGFVNYIISLPLLFMAVLDFERFAGKFTARELIRHALYPALLMLNHPYTVLVYISLATFSAATHREDRKHALRLLFAAGTVAALFAVWFALEHHASSSPTARPWGVKWVEPRGGALFYIIMFTGMRWRQEVDWITIGLWGIVAGLFLAGEGKVGDRCFLRLVRMYEVVVIGYVALPFFLGYYSFFNLRLAPVSYFALTLLLCRIRLSPRSGILLGMSVFGLIMVSIQTQRALAREVESVLPVVSAAPRNALILPLMYDSKPKAIDLSEMHEHEANYYHVLVGGGANPTLFPNAMMPVQYRRGLHLPYPRDPLHFSWEEHGAYYDYLVTRRAPPDICRSLSLTCDLVAESGPWKLFKNRGPRRQLPVDDGAGPRTSRGTANDGAP